MVQMGEERWDKPAESGGTPKDTQENTEKQKGLSELPHCPDNYRFEDGM